MVRRSRQNKRQQHAQQVQFELDLHGLTCAEAEPQIYQFLRTAEDRWLPKVRIITGKGTGVLREHTQKVLRQMQYTWQIAQYNEGGEGALVVYLH